MYNITGTIITVTQKKEFYQSMPITKNTWVAIYKVRNDVLVSMLLKPFIF